jgi:DNA polymerase family B
MDSETLQGPPITLQFYSEQTAKRFNGCIFIGKRAASTVYLDQLNKLPPGRYRMYGFNLEFDMLSILWNVKSKLLIGTFEMKIGNWEISGRFTKPIFAIFKDETRTVELVDAMLWFQTSLAKAGDIVCPDLPKLRRPAGLGTKMFKASDAVFVEYAMRDAVIAYHLGVAIERFHEELGIPSQISLASMAAACFRINYLQRDIYQPPRYEWMAMAAASYHGGVNRVRAGMSPGWHTNVTALDLSSAYPYAMSQFPDFSNATGYRAYKRVKGRTPKSVPELGVYKVSGVASKCDWPALFGHDFKPLQGRFAGQAVSGYELNVAIQSGEVKLTSIEGCMYVSSSAYSPFRAYVSYFYKMKAESTDPVMRYMYKIMLNGLTGKFIQTSEDFTLIDGQLVKIQRAGGLYQPFIASLITGHTRSVMHPLEHRYKALHTATDGIFAPGNHKGAKKKELGAVIDEGHGDLALLRNKLYILYTDDESESTFPSEVFEGRHILKCARHGFQGTVANLEQMLISTIRKYKVNRPLKLKSATKSGGTPNMFVKQARTLNLEGEFKIYNHG